MSSARNAGESAICPMPAQPSAEIVRVECAKRRRECDLGSWKMRTGDLLVQLWYAKQSVELEAENWRLASTTLVRGAICGARR